MSTWYKIEFYYETLRLTYTGDFFSPDIDDFIPGYVEEPLLIDGKGIYVPYKDLSSPRSDRDDDRLYSQSLETFEIISQDRIEGTRLFNVVADAGILTAEVTEIQDAASFAPEFGGTLVESSRLPIIYDGITYTALGDNQGNFPTETLGGGFSPGELVLLGPTNPEVPPDNPFATFSSKPQYIWVLREEDYVQGEPFSGFDIQYRFTGEADVFDFPSIINAGGTLIWGSRQWWDALGGDDVIILPTEEQAEKFRSIYYNADLAWSFYALSITGFQEMFGGSGNDTIDASQTNTPWYLSGDADDDTIIGGGGDDQIWLTEGNDTVTGGGGKDEFILVRYGSVSFSDGLLSTSVIKDFDSSAGEKLDLTRWDGDRILTGNQNFTWAADGFTRNRGEVYVEPASSGSNAANVLIDLTGNGEANHKFIIEGVSELKLSDFLGVDGPVTVRLEKTPASFADEGDNDTITTASIAVKLSQPFTEEVTVEYSTVDDTATIDDMDYTAVAGVVTFAPNSTEEFIEVDILGDDKSEEREKIGIKLSNARTESGAVITIESDEEADFIAIKNDDVALTIKTQDGNLFSLIEGEEAKWLEVSISEPVDYDITVDVQLPDYMIEDLSVVPLITLPAGESLVRVDAFISAVQDNGLRPPRIEKNSESGALNFTAKGGGKDITIERGEETLVNVTDELWGASANSAETRAKLQWDEFAKGTTKAIKDASNVADVLDPALTADAWTKGAVKSAQVFGIVLDGTILKNTYEQRLAAAKKRLDESDCTTADKQAYAFEVYDAQKAFSAEAGVKTAQALWSAGSGATVLAGIAWGLGSTVAALPLAIVGTTALVLAAADFIVFDGLISDALSDGFGENFERSVNRVEFVALKTKQLRDYECGPGTSVPVQITATDDPEEIFLAENAEQTILGNLAQLDGDQISGFGTGKEIAVLNENFARSDMKVTVGSAILDIDADQDGESDATITLEGDFSNGDFMAVADEDDTLISFGTFLPELTERQAVDPEFVNGVINQNFLTGDGTTDFRFSLVDIGNAGYNNVVGIYEITQSGQIVDVQILFENANDFGAPDAIVTDTDAGHTLGLFIIQNAASWFASLDAADEFSFVDAVGSVANLSDQAEIFLAVNGQQSGQTVFHSYDADMNSDGVQHTLSGVAEGGESILLGFEDLTGGGDRDYEDVVVNIQRLVDDFSFV